MIRTNAAAKLLGVSANTLRSWERRYGFPSPGRSPGGHRHYDALEIEALRQALAETNNISSAIALARRRGTGPPSSARLLEALSAFDEQRADRLLEESLAVRSLERTIEAVLLPAVAQLRDEGRPTAPYEFAWRHASGWLSAMKRTAPPATRLESVLIIDAWAAPDLDALHSQALEVVLRRAGLRTLALTATTDRERLGHALRALDPQALVLAGSRLVLDEIARLVYRVRSSCPGVAVFDYRGAVPDSGAGTIERLPVAPVAARDELLRRLEAPSHGRVSLAVLRPA
jgi:DNA-binding transcriptional MerR regulator